MSHFDWKCMFEIISISESIGIMNGIKYLYNVERFPVGTRYNHSEMYS